MSTMDRSAFDFFVQENREHGDVYIELPGTFYLWPAAEALALGRAIETHALRVLGLIGDAAHETHETHEIQGDDSG